jgi:hypothetical protein
METDIIKFFFISEGTEKRVRRGHHSGLEPTEEKAEGQVPFIVNYNLCVHTFVK